MTEPTPQVTPRKASRGRVIAMLILGGIVLAVGGCALFLSNALTNRGNDVVTGIGALGFVAGVVGFIWGCLWGLARLIDRRRPPKV